MDSPFLPALLVVTRIHLWDSSCRVVLSVMGALCWAQNSHFCLLTVEKLWDGSTRLCQCWQTRARIWAGSRILGEVLVQAQQCIPKWCLVMVWTINICPINPDTLSNICLCQVLLSHSFFLYSCWWQGCKECPVMDVQGLWVWRKRGWGLSTFSWGWKAEREVMISLVSTDRTRGNGSTLWQGRFKLDFRQHFFTETLGKAFGGGGQCPRPGGWRGIWTMPLKFGQP